MNCSIGNCLIYRWIGKSAYVVKIEQKWYFQLSPEERLTILFALSLSHLLFPFASIFFFVLFISRSVSVCLRTCFTSKRMKLWPQFLKRCPAVSVAEIQFRTYVMMFLPNSSHHSIYLRTIFPKKLSVASFDGKWWVLLEKWTESRAKTIKCKATAKVARCQWWGQKDNRTTEQSDVRDTSLMKRWFEWWFCCCYCFYD